MSDAPRTDAISRAVVAVPIFVFQNFSEILLIIGPETKSAELSVALIVNILGFLARLLMVWVKVLEQVWEKIP